MTFEELLPLLEELSADDFSRLRDYVVQKETVMKPHPLSAEERIQRLNAAMDAMREGLSEEELDEMIAAMNEEYIESWDESEWTE